MTTNLIAPMETKATTGRRFVGYSSTWDLDFGGDVIERGAFRRTLDHWRTSKNPLPLVDQHNYSSVRSVVGKMIDAHETKDGLESEFEIIQTPDGEEMLARVRGGYVNALSIGYRIRQWRSPTADEERAGAQRFITELQLIEVSLVIWPMNDSARITQLKRNRVHTLDEGFEPNSPRRLALEDRLRDLQLRRMQDTLTDIGRRN